MKADEMERCSESWWVLDKKKQTAAWIHGFHLHDSDSWHPSRGSQWSRNYRDVVRPRRERKCGNISHLFSFLRNWNVRLDSQHEGCLETPSGVDAEGRNPERTRFGLPSGAKYQHLSSDKSFIGPAQPVPSFIYSSLIKMLTCSTVTAAFRPPQSNSGVETSQQMTPHKCRKRGTIDLCSRPNRFKSLITSVAGVHI